ncbi:c-type cytochrome [Amorphus orientalis]|uniref:Mono/diheme cytochrome c family protein n=1 Tax=Amorphus orientalis TaxID=649198 RepID=A0AAE4ATW9_9HYPH|nr:cytochrome c [Amorphus orientalis]MDQ0316680.1 mono/diheme cytochrome c family protein [Amorphus orientalis]
MYDHIDTATRLSTRAADPGIGRRTLSQARRAIAGTALAAPALLFALGSAPVLAQSDTSGNSGNAASQSTSGSTSSDATTGSDATAAKSTTSAAADDLIAKGKYLVTAADCMPCHTGQGAEPFSGGLMLDTPFGGISSPNITPDNETGIGTWSEKEFYRALHNGIGKDGEYLYPAMPYTSFTKITEDDVKAIYAYLQSLQPVNNPRKPNTMTFPFNVRDGLAAWNLLYFTPGTFQPDPSLSDQINRGAYLVEGPGHCGECHTPRNVAGAMENSEFLAGGKLLGQPYSAPNISGSLQDGIGDWSTQEIVDYLHTGADKKKGTVFGPMADVVTHSLSKLTDDDIEAIAVYLKQTKAESGDETKVADTTTKAGSEVYLNNCAQCHQSTGLGISGSVPPLAGNDAVAQAGPQNAITAVLGGLPGQGSYIQMPAFGGQFDDQQIADVVNFVRTNWGNEGSADATPSMVASLRNQVTPTGVASEAARSFGCPAVSESGSQDAITAPAKAILDGFQGVTDAEMSNRVGELVRLVKSANPGSQDADIADTLVAAYCPVVAADGDLTISEKKARIDTFLTEVNSELDRSTMPSGSRVLLQVPVSPEVADQVNSAARAAKEQPGEYLGKLIEDQVKAPAAQ